MILGIIWYSVEEVSIRSTPSLLPRVTVLTKFARILSHKGSCLQRSCSVSFDLGLSQQRLTSIFAFSIGKSSIILCNLFLSCSILVSVLINLLAKKTGINYMQRKNECQSGHILLLIKPL